MSDTMSAARQEFLGRWIAYGTGLFARAEAHGIDWRSAPMEQLESLVILAEEWARPDKQKEDRNTKKRLIVQA